MIFKSFTKRKFRNIELYNKNGGTVVRVNANFAFIWFNNTFMIKSLPSDYYLLNNCFTCFFKQLDLFKVIANLFVFSFPNALEMTFTDKEKGGGPIYTSAIQVEQ